MDVAHVRVETVLHPVHVHNVCLYLTYVVPRLQELVKRGVPYTVRRARGRYQKVAEFAAFQ
jgi:hypothetical protein